MQINKKSIAIVVSCYALWGTHAAYWNLLINVNPMLILCCRIVFALVFTTVLLLISGRLQLLLSILRNKTMMQYTAPAAVLISLNWGLYIWAVNAGHVLDCSLGYYMSPLIAFLLGVLIFREKYTRLQLAAVALAFVGLLVSVITFGDIPYISIGLASSFAAYGVMKKLARTDPVAGIAAETLITTPFAIAVGLIFLSDGFRTLSTSDLLLLIGGGVVTATPLILYARSVNDIPLIIVGFFQYISPSLLLIYGLISGEMLTLAQLVSFIFIGLGLLVFSIALVRISKTEKAANPPPYNISG